MLWIIHIRIINTHILCSSGIGQQQWVYSGQFTYIYVKALLVFIGNGPKEGFQ